MAPDVVGFADFVRYADDACLELSNHWRSWVPDALDVLPYPNGPKLRNIAIARCPDLVMLRAAAGRIVETTDPRLSDRVLSYRLHRRRPAWSFKESRASYKRWRRAVLAEVGASRGSVAAWRTDVENYYGSIDLQLVARQLHEWRCDLDAIMVVIGGLREWTKLVPGLPIGPEVSSVLGNAFLHPLDRGLEEIGTSYFRYMDDVVVLGANLRDEGPLLTAAVDEMLEGLRLRRNHSKTRQFPPGFAAEAVDDMLLSYIARGRQHAETGALVGLLEAEAEEPHADPKRVRFALRGLNNDPAAADVLCANANLLNSDPMETCRYLAKHLRRQPVRDCLIQAMEWEGDRQAALRLHAGRAAAGSSWGHAEGSVLLAVGNDRSEQPIVRAHAWHAAARTPAWNAETAMQAAEAEGHPGVQRAIVLTLQRAAPSRSKDAFLRTMISRRQATYAARWAA